jgi:perosamine synthetase
MRNARTTRATLDRRPPPLFVPTTEFEPSSYGRRFGALLGDQAQTIAFWKGRVALYAILRAIGVGPGDEVILPGFTCVVVPNAIRLAGATPVYADIESHGYNIDLGEAERRVTRRSKALLVQHTFGVPVDPGRMMSIAQRYDLRVIEDCAHALGTWCANTHVGMVGDAGFFSFQWSKPYTSGLGGMAVTRDPDLAGRIRDVHQSFSQPSLSARMRLRVQWAAYDMFFKPRLYWSAQALLRRVSRTGIFVGSSSSAELEGHAPTDSEWRMSGFQEAIGESALVDVQSTIRHRRDLAAAYDERLRRAGWPIQERSADTTLLRYPIRVANKWDLLERARHERIELGTWFESPLHPIPLESHARFGYEPGRCPNAERAARELVNLPLHPRVTPRELDRIAAFFLRHAVRPSASRHDSSSS